MAKEAEKNRTMYLKGSKEIGILLLHGWTSPPDELFPMARYLNSLGYTVSVPLLRGHGTRPEDLECVKWTDWLAQSRDELKKLEKSCKNIFVGGISMGGDLAIMLSGEKSISGTIAMGAAIRFKFHYLAKMALFAMGLTKKYRKKYYPPWLRKKMAHRKVYLYYPIESAKEVVRLTEHVKENLPMLTRPILIMQSTTDHMVSRKSPQIIFDGVKSKVKEIFWIKNAYHVFVEKKEVWEKVGEFMQKAK
jgi:carboxylesterase